MTVSNSHTAPQGAILSKIAKYLLTITAIAPVLLTLAWIAILECKLATGGLLVGFCVILTLTCLWILSYAKKNLEKIDFKFTSIETIDHENIAFLLIYMLPLVSEPPVVLNWHIWVPAIFIIGLLAATSYAYHFNPLMGLIGWHFYKVGTPEGITYMLITKQHIFTEVKTIQTVQLAEYIIIDVEKD